MIGLLGHVWELGSFAAKAKLRHDDNSYAFAKHSVREMSRALAHFATCRGLSIPSVDLGEILDGFSLKLLADDLRVEDGGTTCYETVCIAAIVELLQPRCVFEIGTFRGQRTALFARHVPRNAEIFTLDLEPKDIEGMSMKPDKGDLLYIMKDQIGEHFQTLPESCRVTQLLGDSMTFDFSPFYGRCDLIFVDGGHTYPLVKSDSRHAFKMLKPGGVILWHDYKLRCSETVLALNEFRPTSELFHINETALVVHGLAPRPRVRAISPS
jgi:hypothetical protein